MSYLGSYLGHSFGEWWGAGSVTYVGHFGTHKKRKRIEDLIDEILLEVREPEKPRVITKVRSRVKKLIQAAPQMEQALPAKVEKKDFKRIEQFLMRFKRILEDDDEFLLIYLH